MVRATKEHTFIWELPDWPGFTWNGERLAGPLDAARRSQWEFLGRVKAMGGLPPTKRPWMPWPRRWSATAPSKASTSTYDALEHAQRGGLDVTGWLIWFLSQVEAATRQGVQEVGRVLARGRFWAEVRRFRLNDRQERVLTNVLSPLGTDLAISNRRYRAITGTSRATAVGDLAELAGMGLVVPFGEARSASYGVDLERFLPEGS